MCQSKTLPKNRTCVICEREIFGRADKVFCDIRCKNKYHAAVRRSVKTISADVTKILYKNWTILAGLMTGNCNKFVAKKVMFDKLGFNFNTISGIEPRGIQLRYSIFEFTYYFGHHQNVIVTKDVKVDGISPYLFRRWDHLAPTNKKNS